MAKSLEMEAADWEKLAGRLRKASVSDTRLWLENSMNRISTFARFNFERKQSVSLGKFAPNKPSTLRSKASRFGLKISKAGRLMGFKRGKVFSGKAIRAAKDSGDMRAWEKMQAHNQSVMGKNLAGSKGVGVASGKLLGLYRSQKRNIRYGAGYAVYGEPIDKLASGGGHRYARTFSFGKKNQVPRPLNELSEQVKKLAIKDFADSLIRTIAKM